MNDLSPLATSPLLLHAGRLTMEWEAGGLRYVKLFDKEIVRRVYAAVRDVNWGTVPDEISNVNLKKAEDSFRLTYDVRCCQNEIDFSWRAIIAGGSQGRIEFEMDGVAHSTFRRNRIGFCILHPMELAGTGVEVIQADGSMYQSEFPRYISPENPFLNLAGLRHAVGPDAEVRIGCEGDIFETEDQRNWSDASYKTFCTPLSRPFPVEVKAGERIWQRIVIEVKAQPNRAARMPEQATSMVLEVDQKASFPLPKIGFSLGSETPVLSDLERARLMRLRPGHLQVDVRLSSFHDEEIERAAKSAADLGTALELALYVGQTAESDIERLLKVLSRLSVRVARWAIFPQTGWWTTRGIVLRYAGQLRNWSADIPVGGGTPASFCELNRNRPPTDLLDFVTWSMQPQEHAFDDRSLVETLAAQGAMVESARQFCGGLPLVVGPITLKKRVNSVATGPWPPQPAEGELPVQVDPRQATLFGAGWTLGSIKYLAEAGVSAATYYELYGWKGLMEREAGSRLPEKFPSTPGGVFPLYHLLADLAEFAGGYIVPVRSPFPLDIETMGLARTPQGPPECVLIANLSASDQQVCLPAAVEQATLRTISGENEVGAMRSPEEFRRHEAKLVVRDQKLNLHFPPRAICRVNLQ